MTQAQAHARQQEQIERLCGAAIRALAGETDLHFRGRRLHRGRQPLPLFAPHLQPSLEHDDFASFRGAADGIALRLLHSDAELQRTLRPGAPFERLVFELLEQVRVEALAPPGMPGIAHNLRHRHRQWSLGFHEAGMTASARGILIYTLLQVCRARVIGEPVVEATEGRIEATRAALAPIIGHDLAGLRRQRADQAAYAVHALAIAKVVAEMMNSVDDDATAREPREGDDSDDDNNEAARAAFSLLIGFDGEATERFATAVSERSRVLDAADGGYRVYTPAYDREVRADALVRPALLKEYRATLDRRIAALGINVTRLARDLKALLAVPAEDGWDSAQEEGAIDGRRLALLVSSPTERRLFRVQRHEPLADCLVTFLIDCSGSMREHAETLALMIDVFVRALEKAGVTSEVLGFTTFAWNGGRAQRDWVRAGRPRHPGRLNEVCHLVFKDADTPWRRARLGLAALLKADLFREGIDGEAVDWAVARQLARSDARRLLLVLSDGSPMDAATALANDTHYLDQHLRAVVQRHEESGQVEVFGLGVGLDLSPYYANSHVLDLAALIGHAVFREVVEMIAGRHRH